MSDLALASALIAGRSGRTFQKATPMKSSMPAGQASMGWILAILRNRRYLGL